MKTRVLALLAVLLMLPCMAGCDRTPPLTGAQLRVWLITPLGRNVVKDQQFHINVDALDVSGKSLSGLAVNAEVFDAGGVSLGKYTCRPVADRPGRYQSDPFVPPSKAQAGDWKVTATVGKAENMVTKSETVPVGESLGVQAEARHGFHLEIPPSWDIPDQQTGADKGLIRLNPLSSSDDEKALLEIRYVRGSVDVNAKALREFLLAYRPAEYEKGQNYVNDIVATKVQGYDAWLARGGFVTNLGAQKADRNFSVEVLRFYCEQADRTFTIIKASTFDPVMSEMSAVLDGFDCYREVKQ